MRRPPPPPKGDIITRHRCLDIITGAAAGLLLSLAIHHSGVWSDIGGGRDGTFPAAFPPVAHAEDGSSDRRPPPKSYRKEGLGEEIQEGLPGCTVGNRHLYARESYNFTWFHAKKNLYAVSPDRRSMEEAKRTGQRPPRPRCKRIRVESLSPDKMYQRHFMRSQPVVLEGAWEEHVRDEEFQRNWTLDEIARRWGNDIDIDGMWSGDNAFQRVEHQPGRGYRYIQPAYSKMNMAEFVRKFTKQENSIKAKEKVAEYLNLQQLGLYESINKGWVDIKEPLTLPKLPPFQDLMQKDLNSIRLWLSGRGKVSKLHFDNYDNILAVLSGTKTVYLLDPIHLHRIYPSEVPFYSDVRRSPGVYKRTRARTQRVRHFSPVDVLNPDLDRFPLFRDVVDNNLLTECHVGPGDLLLLPALWWHEVHNDVPEGSYYKGSDGDEAGANVAVNYWYRSHSLLSRFQSMTLDNVALDWVGRAQECEAEFEREAEQRRLARHDIGVEEPEL